MFSQGREYNIVDGKGFSQVRRWTLDQAEVFGLESGGLAQILDLVHAHIPGSILLDHAPEGEAAVDAGQAAKAGSCVLLWQVAGLSSFFSYCSPTATFPSFIRSRSLSTRNTCLEFLLLKSQVHLYWRNFQKMEVTASFRVIE